MAMSNINTGGPKQNVFESYRETALGQVRSVGYGPLCKEGILSFRHWIMLGLLV